MTTKLLIHKQIKFSDSTAFVGIYVFDNAI